MTLCDVLADEIWLGDRSHYGLLEETARLPVRDLDVLYQRRTSTYEVSQSVTLHFGPEIFAEQEKRAKMPSSPPSAQSRKPSRGQPSCRESAWSIGRQLKRPQVQARRVSIDSLSPSQTSRSFITTLQAFPDTTALLDKITTTSGAAATIRLSRHS